ncbi:hypothetical protein GCM10017581_098100 [Dactylosporangium matsuzakiense]|uniref:Carbohydrate ABC transporter substrate-binding protein (CUT1 family) n=1 Tax=Dactylosporangium matsuzakiense TaxID=53360 RepID=A0A9W6NS73_9ACTN|nr:hypothetical protein GCM10017581_098100 [Dactylosporangium matsuzakiense]
MTITFLTGSDVTNATTAKDLIAGFQAQNPDITVKVDSQSGGSSADNAVKTKLATDTMDDVFYYNSGSLFQALNADTKLVNLSDQAWAGTLEADFKRVVSTSKGLYGAPLGTSLAGGVMYNRDVYKRLNLSVPKDWAEFLANSQKIKAAGITAVEQTFGDTWTSQILILADFANITAQSAAWADDYTANKAKYATQPALASFEHLADLKKNGLLNADFASAKNDAGLKAVAEGTAGHYPMLSSLISTVKQNSPDKIDNIGFFPLPADNAADTRLTVWEPSALYIPRTTTGAKLDAAKKFVAFALSKEGCDIQNKDLTPSGPYVTSACALPKDVPSLLNDMTPYFQQKLTGPALEFLSPVKGPNLENIAVQVGSGISAAKDGAALYDDDVKKQAQQLGLKGW